MKTKFIDYKETLLESLKDPLEAQGYLNECLKDEDPKVFLSALKNVLEAQGASMSSVARRASLNRENLYKILSHRGNPRLTSLRSVLNAVGLDLAIQPYRAK